MEEEPKKELESREYQVELFDLAVQKNIILYLPTGSGKTFIATLLIKHFCSAAGDKIYLPIGSGGVRTFFLVNTVALVNQQACQIMSQTTLTIGTYSGDLGVDLWGDDYWENELNTYQIFVMTCQIFLDLITKNVLSLENVNLLIFDECHRAVSNHPMRQVMQRFENVPANQQPRVLGLTATLLNGNIKPSGVREEIRQLERTFMAEIQTSLNEEMVKLYSTNPVESKVTYNVTKCDQLCYRFGKRVLASLKQIVEMVLIEDKATPPPNSRPPNSYQICNKTMKTNKRLINVISDIEMNMDQLGVFGGSLAVLAHLVQVQQMLPNCQQENTRLIFQNFTSDLVLIRKQFEIEMKQVGGSELNKLEKFSSDQVIKLLSILKRVKSSDSAIVFVQRRFSAKVLYYLVDKASQIDPKLAHIKCNFIVGYNIGDPFKDTRENYLQRKQNTKVLNLFKNKELNVLFASNVVEEGVDIAKCNFVIMFDGAQDFRAYVQSKGRARDKDSNFIIMASGSDKNFDSKYKSFHDTEDALKNILYGGKSRLRTLPTSEEVEEHLFATRPGLEPYMPSGRNGPVITALSAIATVNRYFASLRVDKFTRVNHFWYIANKNNKFRCSLQLPMEARNPMLVHGRWQSTVEDAKRSAALEACKILHKEGDLSDKDLLPVSLEVIVNSSNFTPNCDKRENFEEVVNGRTVKLGTKKHKRLCDKKWADCLFECAPQPNQRVYLHLIELTPKYDPPVDSHRLYMVHNFLSLPNHFAILSTKELPKLAPFPLYLSVGELEAKIHPGNKVILNAKELKQISGFHFTIFDSVLQVAKKFMIKDLTNTQNSYFIAPVLVKDNKTINIDWEVIEESNKMFPSTKNKPTIEERQSLKVTDVNYFGRIVTPWYRTVPAQKYIVTKVCYDMSEETQFPTENYDNYKEYFKEKYKIKPLVKGQPLLEVRAISSGLNSIKPRALTKQHKRKNKDENEEFEVFLLPEFCVVYPFPGRYWLKAQLLPSALHRVSQLCIAEELRCTIAKETCIGAIHHSSEWHKLKEDVSLKKGKDSDQDKPQALQPLSLQNNQINSATNMPDIWASEEEPVDLERNLESLSLFDIFGYDCFIKKSFSKTVENCGSISLAALPGSKKLYNKKVVNAPPLAVLKGQERGPQQVEVLQALTAAVANDIVNCERLETLGDSFLKFAVSVSLFVTQANLQEGHLTNIKGEIVGNKNLYFCGKKKGLGPMLGVDDFSPNEEWVAPGFHVPLAVQNVIKSMNASVNCLYSVEIPDADRKSDVEMTSATLNLFEESLLNCEDVGQPQNCSFTNQLALTDKNISDSVEALLGVYLKSSGIVGALDLMNWFGVTDPNLSTPEVFRKKPVSAALGPGNPNNHLQQPENLESILNYKFRDRSFLLQALTHPSYTRNNITKCYQCLEFLGDAVIDFLITVHIFEKCSTLTPGDLTDLRSALVNNVTLACISVRNHLHKFLLYHSFLLSEFILRFVKNQEEKNHVIDHDILFLVEEDEVKIAEAVDVPKALGDLFEALIGAVYLDSNKDLNVTWTVVYNLMKEEIESFSKDIPKNHVRMLYESGSLPDFRSSIDASNGVVLVTVDILHHGVTKQFNGFGENKRQAKRAAAKHALRYLRSMMQP